MELLRKCRQVSLALAALLSFTQPLSAQQITINSLSSSGGDEWWSSYNQHSWDTLHSANRLVSYGAIGAHNALRMQERSEWERALFMLTIGQAAARATWANSVLGHEYAHFANAHRLGLKEHYFVDDDSGERFDWQTAWLNSFVGGDPNGPATSRGEFNDDVSEGDTVEMSLAGLNWQMGYSEKYLRDWLSGSSRTVFDTPDLVMNRVYMTSYATGTLTEVNGSPWGGDIGRFDNHIEAMTGDDKVSEKVILTGVLANILSPNILSAGGGILSYIQTGSLEVSPHLRELRNGSHITWDIPQFLNKDSMTVAPTVYWMPNEEQKGRVGANSIVVGFGVETPTIGSDNSEARLSFDGQWDTLSLGMALSSGKSGQYLEFESGYRINDSVGVSFGLATAAGETLRGRRFLPDDDFHSWVGLNVSF